MNSENDESRPMLRYWGAGMVAVLGFLALRLVTSQAQIPVYAGKTVVQWLDGGYEDAALAIQEIGPPAIPYVLAKVSHEDPRFGSWCWYRQFWDKLPSQVRVILPKPRATNFDELRACSVLLEIGPPAIPTLSLALKDKNPIIRQTSAHALRALHERGTDISKAIPCLIKALRDSNAEVRKHAGSALGREHLATK